MRISPARHDRSRPGHRTGAILAVLLAALVHLLCCAHGPVASAAGRADTITAVAPAPCGQPAGPHAHFGDDARHDGHQDGAQCSGTDEPSVQAPRGLQPAADLTPVTLPGADLDPAAEPTPRRPFGDSGPRLAAPAGQQRAHLGIWRT
ncbi:hypothetical protein [Streptomyces xanthii]|uniref:Uncharacterized protein n=1 Tax=Streptomyces xanthii TaxID=2768069 RepID=A0A7H1B1H3_9ACTN|nr:hypothetical protein [Streptomyces xanthii]QNS02578.1 hypothetical protein IAG42_02370 [Streptomyces xanthii]